MSIARKVTPDPYRPGDYLVEEIDGVWNKNGCRPLRRLPYAVTGVFDTLKAVSKLVLKSLG